ncbi:MAG: flagellar motor protein MotB [Vicinamibacterales bacterium]
MNIKLTATQVSRDRWLVSSADFMTLLCAFFLTMYGGAGPAVETPKPLPLPAPVKTPEPSAAETAAREAAERAAALRAQVETALAPELAAGYLQLVDDPRGLVVEVPEAGAFDIGQADLSPEAAGMLKRVAGVLTSVPNPVRIEGHTDTADPHLALKLGAVDGAGDARGVVPDRTGRRLAVASLGRRLRRVPAARRQHDRRRRARNRRVDLVLLNEATAKSEEPAEVQPWCPFTDAELARLLERPVRHLLSAADRKRHAGRRLLITGGGSSGGLQLSRQLADCAPA